ncbi:trypsin-like peptidase domain-containing protein [Actinomycetaceae bacterium MB13-C1-2]|nr:trypsin-like peptidase domain-containing protein [Actinomycetaceae bacterium MB13-C1-2]
MAEENAQGQEPLNPTGNPAPTDSDPSQYSWVRQRSESPFAPPGQTPYPSRRFATQNSVPQGGFQGSAPQSSVPQSGPRNPYVTQPFSTPSASGQGGVRPPAPPAGGGGAWNSGVPPLSAPPPQKTAVATKRGPGWLALVTAMVVTALLTSGLWFGMTNSGLVENGLASNINSSTSTPTQSGEVLPPVTEGVAAPDWEEVAATVRQATVSITVEGQSSAATGSGVVYDSSGYIVTNHHVVEPAIDGGKITVSTHDGLLYEATILGTDQTTDLAVLKVSDSANLVAARFGTSSDLKVGQPVMAVGSPLGLADTVTTGVISALDRPVSVAASGQIDPLDPSDQAPAEMVVTNAIQIDASINPGNSGGPLFEATGDVIGINSSIASNSSSAETAGSIGLGFAIPVDLVKNVVDQIITTGSVQHALLGVSIQSVSFSRGDSGQLGAEVVMIVPGGAAEQAGLQTGDIIVGIDGKPVTASAALTGYVRRHAVGDVVTLDVVRDGQDMQVEATLQSK